MFDVVCYPHPALSRICAPVTTFDETLHDIVQKMYDTMEQKNGIGLAANQVNINQYFFIMKISDIRHTFINPVILHKAGSTLYKEGCLSFPGIVQEIERFEHIYLRWQDLSGEFHEQEFRGLDAICIQHEMDHINGKTFLDRLSPLKKQIALKKYQKLIRK